MLTQRVTLEVAASAVPALTARDATAQPAPSGSVVIAYQLLPALRQKGYVNERDGSWFVPDPGGASGGGVPRRTS